MTSSLAPRTKSHTLEVSPAVLSFLEAADFGVVGGSPTAPITDCFLAPNRKIWESLSDSAHKGYLHRDTFLNLLHLHRYAEDLSDLCPLEEQKDRVSPSYVRCSEALSLFGKLPAMWNLEGKEKIPNNEGLSTFEILSRVDSTFNPTSIGLTDFFRILMLNSRPVKETEVDIFHLHSDYLVVKKARKSWRSAYEPYILSRKNFLAQERNRRDK